MDGKTLQEELDAANEAVGKDTVAWSRENGVHQDELGVWVIEEVARTPYLQPPSQVSTATALLGGVQIGFELAKRRQPSTAEKIEAIAPVIEEMESKHPEKVIARAVVETLHALGRRA